MLAHLGIPYNRDEEFETFISRLSRDENLEKAKGLNAMELAHLVEGVDVIVTGGIAKGYDKPWEDPKTHTLIVQNYGNLSGVGHLELLIDQETKSISGYEFPTDRGMLITLLQDDILPDSKMATNIQSWVDESKRKVENQFINSSINPNKNVYLTNLKRLSKSDRFPVPNLGKPEQLEIVTWNLEWFPKSTQTVTRVAEILYALRPDIVGLQEIVDLNALNQIVDGLNQYDEANNWEAYFAGVTNSSKQELAFIVNKNSLSITQTPFEIYHDDDMAFPRAPYVIQIQVNGKEWIIITE